MGTIDFGIGNYIRESAAFLLFYKIVNQGINIVEVIFCDNKHLNEWDEYVLGQDIRTPYLLSAFRNVIMNTFQHEPIYLMARSSGKITGILPIFYMNSLFFGKLFASLPFLTYGGAMCKDFETEEKLFKTGIEEAKKRKARFWVIRNNHEIDEREEGVPGGFHVSHEKLTVLLSLPSNEEELWKGFRSKLRSQISKAQKNGLVSREGREEDLGPFYKIFTRNMRDLGSPAYPMEFFGNILKEWKESKIFTVWHGQTVIAGAMTIGWRNRIEIPWASTDRRYNRLAPNMLLYYSIMQSAVRHGYSLFDFGRCTPGEGTHQFKLQWGGTEKKLTWLYWTDHGAPPVLNRNNPKFTFLSDGWKFLPVSVATTLGRYLIRNIP